MVLLKCNSSHASMSDLKSVAPILLTSVHPRDNYLRAKQVPCCLISSFFNHSHSHKAMLHLSSTVYIWSSYSMYTSVLGNSAAKLCLK